MESSKMALMDFLQERIGDTDIENGLMDIAEKGEIWAN